jgi:hypothetical protein
MHEITTDADGNQHGSDGVHTVSLMIDGMTDTGRMFKRRAVKAAGTPEAVEVNWLVCELNGVRVYQQGDAVIVTTRDMYP